MRCRVLKCIPPKFQSISESVSVQAGRKNCICETIILGELVRIIYDQFALFPSPHSERKNSHHGLISKTNGQPKPIKRN